MLQPDEVRVPANIPESHASTYVRSWTRTAKRSDRRIGLRPLDEAVRITAPSSALTVGWEDVDFVGRLDQGRATRMNPTANH